MPPLPRAVEIRGDDFGDPEDDAKGEDSADGDPDVGVDGEGGGAGGMFPQLLLLRRRRRGRWSRWRGRCAWFVSGRRSRRRLSGRARRRRRSLRWGGEPSRLCRLGLWGRCYGGWGAVVSVELFEDGRGSWKSRGSGVGVWAYQNRRLVHSSIQSLEREPVQGIEPDVAVMQVWAPELGAQLTALQHPR